MDDINMEGFRLDYELVKYLCGRDTDINEHLTTLYYSVKELNAKTVVELGAGQSSFALAVATSECGGKFYSIDVDVAGAVERLFPEGKKLKKLLDGLPEYVAIDGDDMEVVKTWNKPIDFLLIDTSHTYKHTKRELKAWLPFVRKGGKIALHDTASSDPNCGVKKALGEYLEKNGGYSVVHYSDTKRIGLSVLTKND